MQKITNRSDTNVILLPQDTCIYKTFFDYPLMIQLRYLRMDST